MYNVAFDLLRAGATYSRDIQKRAMDHNCSDLKIPHPRICIFSTGKHRQFPVFRM